jgi:plastocyanin
VAFNDTVILREETGLVWDGDEWAILHGTPFGDSLVMGPVTDSLKFVVVGEVGTYSLAVTGLGPQAETQVTPLGIVSVRYATHSRAMAPVLPTAALSQSPVTRFLALGAQPGDTLDHFRLEPSALLSVTATAESPGLEAASLRWYLCASVALATLGTSSRLSGVVVDERKAPVIGARVGVPGTAVQAMSGSLGEFSITGIPPSATTGGIVEIEVSKLGFVPRVHRVQAGDSVRIHLVSTGAHQASARSQRGSTVEIPGGECRILQVAVRSGGVTIVRLRLTTL